LFFTPFRIFSIFFRIKGEKFIAHKILGEEYILRVIYEEYEDEIQVITFYRAKKKRYFRGEK